MSACPLFSSSFTEYLALSQLLKRRLSKLINSSQRLTPKTGVAAALSKFLLRSPELGARASVPLPYLSGSYAWGFRLWLLEPRRACLLRAWFASVTRLPLLAPDGRFPERVAGNPERLQICWGLLRLRFKVRCGLLHSSSLFYHHFPIAIRISPLDGEPLLCPPV